MDNTAQPSTTTPVTPDTNTPPATPPPTESGTPQAPMPQPAPVAPPAPQPVPAQEAPPPPPAPEPPTAPMPATTPAPETTPAPSPATEMPAPTSTPAPTGTNPPGTTEKPTETTPSASLTGNQTPPPPIQPKAKRWKISPWTLLLLLVLAGFSGFFLYIAFSPKTKSVPTTQHIVAPTPTPVAHVLLSLQPTQVGTQGAQLATHSYDVFIDSSDNTVNDVQLELSYDPSVLTNVAVVPGSFFTNPSQLVKDIDTTSGRISYALGIQPKDNGIKGTGIVAQVVFQFQPTATVSSTMLRFLPKTKVGGQGANESVLRAATDVTIDVPGKTTPTPTITGTKTQY